MRHYGNPASVGSRGGTTEEMTRTTMLPPECDFRGPMGIDLEVLDYEVNGERRCRRFETLDAAIAAEPRDPRTGHYRSRRQKNHACPDCGVPTMKGRCALCSRERQRKMTAIWHATYGARRYGNGSANG